MTSNSAAATPDAFRVVSGRSTLKPERAKIRAVHRAGILALASQITPAAAVRTNSAS